METLDLVEPLPFEALGTRWKKVILTIAHTKSGSAAFVSLSSMNDFLIALCVMSPSGVVCVSVARAATASLNRIGGF
jgi:hypothetical protein